MPKKFKVGELVVQQCTMPYPNAIYRVAEVDAEGNFRGHVAFRLTFPPAELLESRSKWLGYDSFRVVTPKEIKALAQKLLDLILVDE